MANLYYIGQFASTTLSVTGGIDNSQTTGIKLSTIPSDIDITKPGIICITWADPLDTDVAEYITYTSIDGTNQLVGATRGQEGYSAKTHNNGATVAFVVSESHINNINDKLTGVDTTVLTDSNGNELLKTAKVASAVNELTITNAATGNNPKIAATGEADTGIILENDQSEEIAIFDSVASAVNEITIQNAATTNPPQVQATGGDTNIDLKLVPKGTGSALLGMGARARVTKNDAQTISTATPTKVQFDDEEYDPGANFAAYGFTCPVAGYYLVNANVGIQSLGDGKFIGVYIYKNAASIASREEYRGALANQSVGISTVAQFAKNDVIYVYIQHNHGSDRSTQANPAVMYFDIHLLSV